MRPQVYLNKWGILERSRNKLDGYREHLMHEDGGKVALFQTRKQAQDYAERHLGYLRNRPDLRAEPHGWMLPKPIRLTVTYKEPTP